MSNLIEHAKAELEAAGLLNPETDFYGGNTGKAVLELIEVFSKQGHSGMSAPLVISIFSKAANFMPLSPITGEESEWNEIGKEDDSPLFQNKRCSSIFKKGIAGIPYYLDAIVWEDESCGRFTGTVSEITSRQFIKLPFTPKTFYVKVDKDRKIIDDDAILDAFDYYREP